MITMEQDSYKEETLLQIINNQIRDKNPPDTKRTYKRLQEEGYSKKEAKRLISRVLESEILLMLKNKEYFKPERFKKALDKLPKI
jgi:hypothetical protein